MPVAVGAFELAHDPLAVGVELGMVRVPMAAASWGGAAWVAAASAPTAPTDTALSTPPSAHTGDAADKAEFGEGSGRRGKRAAFPAVGWRRICAPRFTAGCFGCFRHGTSPK